MTGIYGNNTEDKFFENKLLNENEGENEMTNKCNWCDTSFYREDRDAKDPIEFCSVRCETYCNLYYNEEITDESVYTLERYLDILQTSKEMKPVFTFLKEMVIPTLKVMCKEDIIDAKHLSQHIADLNRLTNSSDVVRDSVDEIRYELNRIENLFREE